MMVTTTVNRVEFVFRHLYYDRRVVFGFERVQLEDNFGYVYQLTAYSSAAEGLAAELIAKDLVYWFGLDLNPETEEGDAILVHSARFNDTRLLINLRDCPHGWGGVVYAVIPLDLVYE